MRFRSTLPLLAVLAAVALSPLSATAAAAPPSPHADRDDHVGARPAPYPTVSMVITSTVAAPVVAIQLQRTAVNAFSALSVPPTRAAADSGSTSPEYLRITVPPNRVPLRSRIEQGTSRSYGGPSLEGRHPLGGGSYRRWAPPAP